VTFNEAALSDLQILCFYAYSPLFASDNGGQNDQLRTQLLGPDRCVGARMSLQLGTQVAGVAALGISVTVPSGNGQFAAAPNLLIEVTPSCGSVDPASGRTDANGQLTVTARPDPLCPNLTLDVVARANANAAPLVRQQASAPVSVVATFAGSLQRIVTTSNGPSRSSGSEKTNVALVVQADANGELSLVSASGSRVVSGVQTFACTRPPNSTPDVRTVGGDSTDTLLGGSAAGTLESTFESISFQPFSVNVEAVIIRQGPIIVGPPNDPVDRFNDCLTETLHVSRPSNPVPINVTFGGSAIVDAQGGVVGFDFASPAETVIKGDAVTTTTVSGRLIRQ
jgi:hypothetical protein